MVLQNIEDYFEYRNSPNQRNWSKTKNQWIAKWRYIYIHNPDKPLTKKPKFFFEAWSFKCGKLKSGSLEVGAEVKVPAYFPNGSLATNTKYQAKLCDGSVIEGTTNSLGEIDLKNVIPGEIEISFDESNYTPYK